MTGRRPAPRTAPGSRSLPAGDAPRAVPAGQGPRPAPPASARALNPGPAWRSATGQWQGRSGLMAQRAWLLRGDLAGAGTAMITAGAVPAQLPAYTGVSQVTWSFGSAPGNVCPVTGAGLG